MKKPQKAKFRVGQVVASKVYPKYVYKIALVEWRDTVLGHKPDVIYQYTDGGWDWEMSIRRLTKREAGR